MNNNFTTILSNKLDGTFETTKDNLLSTLAADAAATAVTTASTVTAFKNFTNTYMPVAKHVLYSGSVQVAETAAASESYTIDVKLNASTTVFTQALTLAGSATMKFNIKVELIESSADNFLYMVTVVGLNGVTPVTYYSSGSIAKNTVTQILVNGTNATTAALNVIFQGGVVTISR